MLNEVKPKTHPHRWWNNNRRINSWYRHDIIGSISNTDLTHSDRVTHICVSKLNTIIIWTKAGLLLIGPRGTNYDEVLSDIIKSSSKKIHLNVLSAKLRQFCFGFNVLNVTVIYINRHEYSIYSNQYITKCTQCLRLTFTSGCVCPICNANVP